MSIDKDLLADLSEQFSDLTTNDGEVINPSKTEPPSEQTTPINEDVRSTQEPETQTQTQTQTQQTPQADAVVVDNKVPDVSALREVFGEDVDITTAKTRYQQILDDNKKLSEQANAKTPISEQVAKFDAFIKKTNIEDYELMRKVSTMEPTSDPIETILTAQRLSYGTRWNDKVEMALRNQLINKYQQDDTNYTEEEMTLGRFELENDAKKSWDVIANIKTALDEAKTTVAPSVDYNAVQAEIAPVFKDYFGKSGINRVELSEKFKIGSDEVEIPLIFDVPTDQLQVYQNQIIATAAQNGIRAIDSTMEANIKSYVTMMAIGQNYKDVLKKAIQLGIERATEVYDRQQHNPSAINRGDNAGDVNAEKSDWDASVDVAYQMLMKEN